MEATFYVRLEAMAHETRINAKKTVFGCLLFWEYVMFSFGILLGDSSFDWVVPL